RGLSRGAPPSIASRRPRHAPPAPLRGPGHGARRGPDPLLEPAWARVGLRECLDHRRWLDRALHAARGAGRGDRPRIARSRRRGGGPAGRRPLGARALPRPGPALPAGPGWRLVPRLRLLPARPRPRRADLSAGGRDAPRARLHADGEQFRGRDGRPLTGAGRAHGRVGSGEETVSRDGRVLIPPEARGVSLVFQDLALWPHLTARETLELVLSREVPREERRRRAEEALAAVGLERHAEARPASLAGRERPP